MLSTLGLKKVSFETRPTAAADGPAAGQQPDEAAEKKTATGTCLTQGGSATAYTAQHMMARGKSPRKSKIR